MTRLAVVAVLALAPTTRAADPNPRTLTVSPADRDRAEGLARRLGDSAFRVREEASRELFRMGRLALPVVEKTLVATDDPEVRARCEWLLPKAVAADQKARLDAFLADADGKFEHDLPGWNELAKAAGSGRTARELFADMVKVKANADLFATLRNQNEFGPKLANRRVELYYRSFRATDGRRDLPAGPEVAGLILAELAAPGPPPDRRFMFTAFSTVTQPSFSEYLSGTGKGEATRKLIAHWLDTRTDPNELMLAMNVASSLNLKELPAANLAVRVLAREEKEEPANQPAAANKSYTKAQALTHLAKSGDKAYLPVVKKYLSDTATYNVWRFNGRNQQQIEAKIQDIALAMAVVLTGEDPRAYGFDMQNPSSASKYSYFNYTFSSPEQRQAAFVKWAFREWRKK